MMKNQMDKKMEHELKTVILQGSMGRLCEIGA